LGGELGDVAVAVDRVRRCEGAAEGPADAEPVDGDRLLETFA
jgi:hypothetical protein